MAEKKLDKEEQYLIDRYGDNLVGFIAYGSMVFGKPRPGSIKDYWVIYRDYEEFHSRNRDFYKHQLNVTSTVEDQILVNREGPNFYAFTDKEQDIHVKLAAMQEDDFCRFCTADAMVVKGRMQKPLKVIRSTGNIDKGIQAARREGAQWGVNLTKQEFTFEEFLFSVLKLSYLADIRPENKDRKVLSILDKGKSELTRIYMPLLEEFGFVEKRGEDRYADTRPPAAKKRLRRETLRNLRRQKWSRQTFKTIFRNYITYRNPIGYLFKKTAGEFFKFIDRVFIYNLFRRKTAEKMIRDYSSKIAGYFGENSEHIKVTGITPAGRGTYTVSVLLDSGSAEKELSCIPLNRREEYPDCIVKDSSYRFIIVERTETGSKQAAEKET